MPKLLHFALYSKGWYKRFNQKSKRKTIWDDLRCTMTADEYSGEHMTIGDIVSVILINCQRIDIRAFNDIREIISGIAKENCWKFGYYSQGNCDWFKDNPRYSELPEYDYWEAVVRYCMSNVAGCMIEDLGSKLPEPSPSVLPLTNNVSKSKIRNSEVFEK